MTIWAFSRYRILRDVMKFEVLMLIRIKILKLGVAGSEVTDCEYSPASSSHASAVHSPLF